MLLKIRDPPKKVTLLILYDRNLNSISAYNIEKFHLLQAFNCVHKFDLICLSETYLNSTFSCNWDGFKLIKADHPNNVRSGGICIFYNEKLPLSVEYNSITQVTSF